MAESGAAFRITFAIEGEYQNSPSDRGGETKYGISKKQYPTLDIRNLTPIEAFQIYKRDFWDKYRVGEIENQLIANQVFDMVFNMDYTQAAKCIQRALYHCGFSPVIDGVMGSKTIEAINLSHAPSLLDAIRVERLKQCLLIADKDRSQRVNLLSWMRRSLT